MTEGFGIGLVIVFFFLSFLVYGCNNSNQQEFLCEKLYPLKKDFDYCFKVLRFTDMEYKFKDNFLEELNKEILDRNKSL